MRCGRDYRLNIALARLAEVDAGWTPPPGERETLPKRMFRRGRVRWTDPNHYAVMEKGAREVYVEQEGRNPRLPFEPVVLNSDHRLMDWLLSDMSESDCVKLFEEAALRGSDARDTLPAVEDDEPATVYSRRWTRVSDETFLLYGRLEDRRPA